MKRDIKIIFSFIANEPTPYNADLFNAFNNLKEFKLSVVHTTSKDWDSSHDFREFPVQKYFSHINQGKGLQGKLKSAFNVLREVLRPNRIIIIAGYASIPHVIAILTCSLFHIPFALWTDQFNVGSPEKGGFITKLGRDLLRKLIINNAFAILVAGKPGVESAKQIGCAPEKILDFPYVVDPDRLWQCQNIESQIVSNILKRAGENVRVFFSGRLIQRKGLGILLNAFNRTIEVGVPMFLIIEGEGPLMQKYQELVKNYGIEKNCMFVGFMQMSEHATLLANSDIVVVPSIYDPWGIVVHEGMLFGKPVIASNSVGSAIDRIIDGENGYLYEPENQEQLANLLIKLYKNNNLRNQIGNCARITAEKYAPEKNVELLLTFIKTNNITMQLK